MRPDAEAPPARERWLALDGLRGLLLIVVIISHAAPGVPPAGFVALDVFFALSGFVITRLVLSELRVGRFRLRAFYGQRALRLVPNVAPMILFTAVAFAALAGPAAARLAGSHGLWAIANLSTVPILERVGGYWGALPEATPLLHTWSLSVEEQFYLLWPLLLLALHRLAERDALGVVLVLCGVSLLGASWACRTSPDAAYVLLPFRAWQVLAGCALALWDEDGHAPGWAGTAGLLALAVSFVVLPACGSPGWPSLLPVGAALVIIASVRRGSSLAARLLTTRPLLALGRRSYSIYLWHWPFMTLGRHLAWTTERPATHGALVGLALSLLAAEAAYRWVEQPIHTAVGPARRVASAATVGLVLLAVGSSAVAASLRGQPSPFAPTVFAGFAYSAGRRTEPDPAQRTARYADVVFPPAPVSDPQPWRRGGVKRGTGTPRVVVLGSSHSLMYGHVVEELCAARSVPVAFLGADATPALFDATVNEAFPTIDEAREFDAARRTFLASWRPAAVFVFDRWELRATGPDFEARLDELITAAATNADQVWFVLSPPMLPVPDSLNLREHVDAWRQRVGSLPVLAPVDFAAARARAEAALAAAQRRHANVNVIPVDDLFLRQDGTVRYLDGDAFLFADDDHLSERGAQRVRRRLAEALDRSLAKP